MDLGLSSTRALVTASSTGLGRACAAALAAEGARVVLCARDAERLERTGRELGAEGVIASDLAQPGEPERVVAFSAERLGGLDILVCNAGGPPPGTFESTPPEAWEMAHQLTLVSAVRMIRAALGLLKSSGRGRIINITSISVRQPIGNLILSNAYRSAVTAMAKSLSFEVAASGVTVNNLAPQGILTQRLRQLHGESLEGVGENLPMRRFGTVEEFGAACAFLASVQAAYITGQTLGVDGGALLGIH
ncbi:MAG TPA: SDR family oxidoreductase [Candidatus Nitrosotalea sp.]|nr:SDR family oxidoreductase [Candidatus Nitrosotalea sp.]